MSAHHEALHAAVLAAPDDDAPRLVYADWLTEQGDPRGEFIAVEVARARLSPGDPREKELAARRDELWRQHGAAWVAPFAPHYIHRDCFHRGFLEELHDYGNVTMEIPDDALRDACLRRLFLCNPTTLAGIERWLHRVPELTLNMEITPRALAALLAKPAFATLETLIMAGRGKNVEHLRRLGAAQLPKLRSLALTSQGAAYQDGADPGTFAGFAGWSGPSLRAMRLEHSPIGAGGLAAVIDTAAFAALETLDVPGSGIGEADIAALCASTVPLVGLDVAYNALGPGAARAIAATPRFAALARLGLTDTKIGDEGVAALVASPYLPKTCVLALDGELFNLGVDVWIDGTAVTGANWTGEPSGPVTERFQVVVQGAPRWETCLKFMPS